MFVIINLTCDLKRLDRFLCSKVTRSLLYGHTSVTANIRYCKLNERLLAKFIGSLQKTGEYFCG